MKRAADDDADLMHQYRSGPERDIAALLDQYDLPFIYEKPTAVMDHGRARLWYPDFTLDYGILIEYFGINGNQGYRARTRHKLKVYEENQLTVLPLYPPDLARSTWRQDLLGRIDATLDGQLSDYRGRVGRAQPQSSPYNKSAAY